VLSSFCVPAALHGCSRRQETSKDKGGDPRLLHRLSFDLCHLYARATKIVSRPAPVYYAHRAAFLAQYYNDNYREDNLFEVGSTSSHGSAASSASTCSTLAGNTDKTVYFA
jgi:hypothetical protein